MQCIEARLIELLLHTRPVAAEVANVLVAYVRLGAADSLQGELGLVMFRHFQKVCKLLPGICKLKLFAFELAAQNARQIHFALCFGRFENTR